MSVQHSRELQRNLAELLEASPCCLWDSINVLVHLLAALINRYEDEQDRTHTVLRARALLSRYTRAPRELTQ